ncbi:class I SAM-dependent methyltransferase [Candidatus Pelagibacter bacterium]|nr:class I SAM-dependent methyltransferase [Candidatus Pelagibacter bacterium]MDA8835163.1 class I SAM-dependent methyltransferase [Candidatus Pelagibacter bacterium]
MNNFLKKNPKNIDGILSYKINDTVTNKVVEFYKETPFPNYKDNDDKYSILNKGNANFLASQFKKSIGFKKNILEVGCGTGQLSNYFSLGTNNEIVALDPTLDSLKLAKKFADKNNISNIKFVNADIFDDVLLDDYFDFIWCNGVLHHTKDPYGAFEILIKSLKKNGYVLIGLYNKIGRIRTVFRRYIYKFFGRKVIQIIDPTLRSLKFNESEKNAWIRDQYIHPVESLHTIDEVLIWFKKNQIDFVSSIPSADFDYDYKNIFEKKSFGSFFSRIFNQILMVFNTLGSDGGLFVLIGKKK